MSDNTWREWSRHLCRAPRRPGADRGSSRRLRSRYRPTIEWLEDRVLPAQVFWNVDADGFWNVAANWRDDQGVSRVPGAGDDVVIDRPAGDFTVTYRDLVSSVRSITARERLVIGVQGGTAEQLTVSGTVDATAGLTVASATLAGATLSAGTTVRGDNGTLSWTTVNGTIDLAGPGGARTLNIANGLTLNGTMRIGSDDGNLLGSAFFNGTQTLDGTGTVLFGTSTANFLGNSGVGDTLTLGPGLTIRGGGGTIGESHSTLVNYATITTSGLNPLNQPNSVQIVGLDNRGQVRVEGGAALTLSSRALLPVTWTNRGTISAENASLTLDGRFQNLGRIEATESTVVLRGTFTLADLGSLQRTGGTVELRGTLNNEGTTLVLDDFTGPWRINGGKIHGGTVAPAGSDSLTFGNSATFDGVTVAGTIDLSRSLTSLLVSNGLTLNGTLLVGAPTFSSGVTFTGNQTLSGAGRVVLNNPVSIFGPDGFSTLTVGPNLTIEGSGRFGFPTVNTNFILLGSLTATTGTATLTVPAHIDGTGALASPPQATVEMDRDLLGTTGNVDAFSLRGRTRVINSGFTNHLEVMSRDLGPTADGFQRNFAYGTLELGNGATLQLVDDADNAAGTGPEALYAEAVIVPATATLDLNGFAVYARGIRIDGTVINGSVVQIPDGGPIAPGTATPGRIAAAGELDDWTFFGRRGQAVTVVVNPGATGTPAPPAPTLQNALVRLVDDAGFLLDQASNTSAGQLVTLSDIALPADGTYHVQVRAPAAHSGSTGNYLVTLWSSTADVARLALNEPQAGRVETPFSVDRWQFTALAG
jgi:hypothetical protein